MFRFRLMTFLVFASLLVLPTTDLLAMKRKLNSQDEDSQPISGKTSSVRQATGEPHRSIEDLPDDVLLIIFSFLNQKDIPSVTRTNQRWDRLMNNNQLWKGYAKKAFIIRKDDTSQGKNYKALVKDYCIPSFTDLGTLNGGTWSSARGVNFDGSVIVGEADDGAAHGQYRAFRWTAEKGMESLGTLNRGTWSSALGTSFDGSVIVGEAKDGAAKNQQIAFRWTAEKGMESLGTLNGGTWSSAHGVSFVGSVIIGEANDYTAQGQRRAFRWTAEKGMESLGSLNGGNLSFARGVSFEGSVIVGEANDYTAQGQQRAFRWTPEKGMESLGTLNGGTESYAQGISSDGSVIVGSANDGTAQGLQIAFRWTAEKGMESLGTLNGGALSSARSVSFDGSVIVGDAEDGSAEEDRAFRWTAEKGMESVEKLLTDKGLLPIDWTLTEVNAITPNGVVLIGDGKHKVQLGNGNEEIQTCAWRAVIPRANLF